MDGFDLGENGLPPNGIAIVPLPFRQLVSLDLDPLVDGEFALPAFVHRLSEQ